MDINRFNFIYGESGSGKTTAALEFAKLSDRKCLVFDIGNGWGTRAVKSGKIMKVTMQNPTYQGILQWLKPMTGSWDVVIDDINQIPSDKDCDLNGFLGMLPKKNRYFFVISCSRNQLTDGYIYRRESFLFMDMINNNQISTFRCLREKTDGRYELEDVIRIRDNQADREFPLRELKQEVRDSKIKQILYEPGETE